MLELSSTLPTIFITEDARDAARDLSAESIKVDRSSLSKIIAKIAISEIPENLLLCKSWDKINKRVFYLTSRALLLELDSLTEEATENFQYAKVTIPDWDNHAKIREYTARALLFGNETKHHTSNRTSPIQSLLGSLGVNKIDIKARAIAKDNSYGVPFMLERPIQGNHSGGCAA